MQPADDERHVPAGTVVLFAAPTAEGFDGRPRVGRVTGDAMVRPNDPTHRAPAQVVRFDDGTFDVFFLDGDDPNLTLAPDEELVRAARAVWDLPAPSAAEPIPMAHDASVEIPAAAPGENDAGPAPAADAADPGQQAPAHPDDPALMAATPAPPARATQTGHGGRLLQIVSRPASPGPIAMSPFSTKKAAVAHLQTLGIDKPTVSSFSKSRAEASPSGALWAWRAKLHNGPTRWFVVHVASGMQVGTLVRGVDHAPHQIDEVSTRESNHDRTPASFTLPDEAVPGYLEALECLTDITGRQIDWTQSAGDVRRAMRQWTDLNDDGSMPAAGLGRNSGVTALHSAAIMHLAAAFPAVTATDEFAHAVDRLAQRTSDTIGGRLSEPSWRELQTLIRFVRAVQPLNVPYERASALQAADEESMRLLRVAIALGFGGDPHKAVGLLRERADVVADDDRFHPRQPRARVLRRAANVIAELHSPQPSEIERLSRAQAGDHVAWTSLSAGGEKELALWRVSAITPDRKWTDISVDRVNDNGGAEDPGRAVLRVPTIWHDDRMSRFVEVSYPDFEPSPTTRTRLAWIAATDSWAVFENATDLPQSAEELSQRSLRAALAFAPVTEPHHTSAVRGDSTLDEPQAAESGGGVPADGLSPEPGTETGAAEDRPVPLTMSAERAAALEELAATSERALAGEPHADRFVVDGVMPHILHVQETDRALVGYARAARDGTAPPRLGLGQGPDVVRWRGLRLRFSDSVVELCSPAGTVLDTLSIDPAWITQPASPTLRERLTELADSAGARARQARSEHAAAGARTDGPIDSGDQMAASDPAPSVVVEHIRSSLPNRLRAWGQDNGHDVEVSSEQVGRDSRLVYKVDGVALTGAQLLEFMNSGELTWPPPASATTAGAARTGSVGAGDGPRVTVHYSRAFGALVYGGGGSQAAEAIRGERAGWQARTVDTPVGMTLAWTLPRSTGTPSAATIHDDPEDRIVYRVQGVVAALRLAGIAVDLDLRDLSATDNSDVELTRRLAGSPGSVTEQDDVAQEVLARRGQREDALEELRRTLLIELEQASYAWRPATQSEDVVRRDSTRDIYTNRDLPFFELKGVLVEQAREVRALRERLVEQEQALLAAVSGDDPRATQARAMSAQAATLDLIAAAAAPHSLVADARFGLAPEPEARWADPDTIGELLAYLARCARDGIQPELGGNVELTWGSVGIDFVSSHGHVLAELSVAGHPGVERIVLDETWLGSAEGGNQIRTTLVHACADAGRRADVLRHKVIALLDEHKAATSGPGEAVQVTGEQLFAVSDLDREPLKLLADAPLGERVLRGHRADLMTMTGAELEQRWRLLLAEAHALDTQVVRTGTYGGSHFDENGAIDVKTGHSAVFSVSMLEAALTQVIAGATGNAADDDRNLLRLMAEGHLPTVEECLSSRPLDPPSVSDPDALVAWAVRAGEPREPVFEMAGQIAHVLEMRLFQAGFTVVESTTGTVEVDHARTLVSVPPARVRGSQPREQLALNIVTMAEAIAHSLRVRRDALISGDTIDPQRLENRWRHLVEVAARRGLVTRADDDGVLLDNTGPDATMAQGQQWALAATLPVRDRVLWLSRRIAAEPVDVALLTGAEAHPHVRPARAALPFVLDLPPHLQSTGVPGTLDPGDAAPALGSGLHDTTPRLPGTLRAWRALAAEYGLHATVVRVGDAAFVTVHEPAAPNPPVLSYMADTGEIFDGAGRLLQGSATEHLAAHRLVLNAAHFTADTTVRDWPRRLAQLAPHMLAESPHAFEIETLVREALEQVHDAGAAENAMRAAENLAGPLTLTPEREALVLREIREHASGYHKLDTDVGRYLTAEGHLNGSWQEWEWITEWVRQHPEVTRGLPNHAAIQQRRDTEKADAEHAADSHYSKASVANANRDFDTALDLLDLAELADPGRHDLWQRARHAVAEAQARHVRSESAAAPVPEDTGAEQGLATTARPQAEPTLITPTHQVDTYARINEETARWFDEQLRNSVPANEYLAEPDRLGSPEGLERARGAGLLIGYAPAGWRGLVTHLRSKGFQDQDLVDAGVARVKNGVLLDFFYNRIMFGIRDLQGRVAGFIGRAMPGNDGAKYLNTPETPLFSKRTLLFGLYEQRDKASTAVPVPVEGPFDTAAILARTGDDRQLMPVGTCGTALTTEHLAALDTVVPLDRRRVLALDPDNAGHKAALATARDAVRVYPELAITTLPDGMDPAVFAGRATPEDHVAAYLGPPHSRPAQDVLVDEIVARWADKLTEVEGHLGAVREAAALIATLPLLHVGPSTRRAGEVHPLEIGALSDAVLSALLDSWPELTWTGGPPVVDLVVDLFTLLPGNRVDEPGPMAAHGARAASKLGVDPVELAERIAAARAADGGNTGTPQAGPWSPTSAAAIPTGTSLADGDHADTGTAGEQPHPDAEHSPVDTPPAEDSVSLPTNHWTRRIQVTISRDAVVVRGTTGADREQRLRDVLNNSQHKFVFRRRESGNVWRYRVPRTGGRSLADAAQAVKDVLAEIAASDLAELVANREAKARSSAAQAEKRAEVLAFPPTAQQQAIRDDFATGADIAVEALAGTGKTTTLLMLAEMAADKQIVYVAFNRAIANEAEEKFQSNVTVNTMHGFARAALINTPYGARLSSISKNDGFPNKIAEILSVTDLEVGSGLDEDWIEAEHLVRLALRVVERYRQSADVDLGVQHLGHEPPPATLNVVDEAVLALAQRIWADKSSSDGGQLNLVHDDYQKVWALSNPRLPADVIFFDEVQDCNEVQAMVVQAQSAQVVVVGDRYQSIYGFRGAKDYLTRWPAEVRLSLTQSWRFGTAVENVGNRFLQLLKADLRLEGTPAIPTVLGPVTEPDAILCRTNAGAVAAVLDAMDNGKRVALVGGGKAIEDIAKAAILLKRGQRTWHEDLRHFPDWQAVKDYAEDHEEAQSLLTLVRLIDKYGPDTVIDMAKALADEDETAEDIKPDLIVSTAHKAKGREWDQVLIADDFRGPEWDEQAQKLVMPDAEALRLGYVAVTRGKKRLDLGSLSWILEHGGPAQTAADISRPALQTIAAITAEQEASEAATAPAAPSARATGEPEAAETRGDAAAQQHDHAANEPPGVQDGAPDSTPAAPDAVQPGGGDTVDEYGYDDEVRFVDGISDIRRMLRDQHWTLIEDQPAELAGITTEHWRRLDASLALGVTHDGQVMPYVSIRFGPFDSADWWEVDFASAQEIHMLVEQCGLSGVARRASAPDQWLVEPSVTTEAALVMAHVENTTLVQRHADAVEDTWYFAGTSEPVVLATPMPELDLRKREHVVAHVLGDRSTDEKITAMVTTVLSGRTSWQGVYLDDVLRTLPELDEQVYRRAVTAAVGRATSGPFDVARARAALERLAGGDPSLPINSIGHYAELTEPDPDLTEFKRTGVEPTRAVRGVVVEVTPRPRARMRVIIERDVPHENGTTHTHHDLPIDGTVALAAPAARPQRYQRDQANAETLPHPATGDERPPAPGTAPSTAPSQSGEEDSNVLFSYAEIPDADLLAALPSRAALDPQADRHLAESDATASPAQLQRLLELHAQGVMGQPVTWLPMGHHLDTDPAGPVEQEHTSTTIYARPGSGEQLAPWYVALAREIESHGYSVRHFTPARRQDPQYVIRHDLRVILINTGIHTSTHAFNLTTAWVSILERTASGTPDPSSTLKVSERADRAPTNDVAVPPPVADEQSEPSEATDSLFDVLDPDADLLAALPANTRMDRRADIALTLRTSITSDQVNDLLQKWNQVETGQVQFREIYDLYRRDPANPTKPLTVSRGEEPITRAWLVALTRDLSTHGYTVRHFEPALGVSAPRVHVLHSSRVVLINSRLPVNSHFWDLVRALAALRTPAATTITAPGASLAEPREDRPEEPHHDAAETESLTTSSPGEVDEPDHELVATLPTGSQMDPAADAMLAAPTPVTATHIDQLVRMLDQVEAGWSATALSELLATDPVEPHRRYWPEQPEYERVTWAWRAALARDIAAAGYTVRHFIPAAPPSPVAVKVLDEPQVVLVNSTYPVIGLMTALAGALKGLRVRTSRSAGDPDSDLKTLLAAGALLDVMEDVQIGGPTSVSTAQLDHLLELHARGIKGKPETWVPLDNLLNADLKNPAQSYHRMHPALTEVWRAWYIALAREIEAHGYAVRHYRAADTPPAPGAGRGRARQAAEHAGTPRTDVHHDRHLVLVNARAKVLDRIPVLAGALAQVRARTAPAALAGSGPERAVHEGTTDSAVNRPSAPTPADARGGTTSDAQPLLDTVVSPGSGGPEQAGDSGPTSTESTYDEIMQRPEVLDAVNRGDLGAVARTIRLGLGIDFPEPDPMPGDEAFLAVLPDGAYLDPDAEAVLDGHSSVPASQVDQLLALHALGADLDPHSWKPMHDLLATDPADPSRRYAGHEPGLRRVAAEWARALTREITEHGYTVRLFRMVAEPPYIQRKIDADRRVVLVNAKIPLSGIASQLTGALADLRAQVARESDATRQPAPARAAASQSADEARRDGHVPAQQGNLVADGASADAPVAQVEPVDAIGGAGQGALFGDGRPDDSHLLRELPAGTVMDHGADDALAQDTTTVTASKIDELLRSRARGSQGDKGVRRLLRQDPGTGQVFVKGEDGFERTTRSWFVALVREIETHGYTVRHFRPTSQHAKAPLRPLHDQRVLLINSRTLSHINGFGLTDLVFQVRSRKDEARTEAAQVPETVLSAAGQEQPAAPTGTRAPEQTGVQEQGRGRVRGVLTGEVDIGAYREADGVYRVHHRVLRGEDWVTLRVATRTHEDAAWELSGQFVDEAQQVERRFDELGDNYAGVPAEQLFGPAPAIVPSVMDLIGDLPFRVAAGDVADPRTLRNRLSLWESELPPAPENAPIRLALRVTERLLRTGRAFETTATVRKVVGNDRTPLHTAARMRQLAAAIDTAASQRSGDRAPLGVYQQDRGLSDQLRFVAGRLEQTVAQPWPLAHAHATAVLDALQSAGLRDTVKRGAEDGLRPGQRLVGRLPANLGQVVDPRAVAILRDTFDAVHGHGQLDTEPTAPLANPGPLVFTLFGLGWEIRRRGGLADDAGQALRDVRLTEVGEHLLQFCHVTAQDAGLDLPFPIDTRALPAVLPAADDAASAARMAARQLFADADPDLVRAALLELPDTSAALRALWSALEGGGEDLLGRVVSGTVRDAIYGVAHDQQMNPDKRARAEISYGRGLAMAEMLAAVADELTHRSQEADLLGAILRGVPADEVVESLNALSDRMAEHGDFVIPGREKRRMASASGDQMSMFGLEPDQAHDTPAPAPATPAVVAVAEPATGQASPDTNAAETTPGPSPSPAPVAASPADAPIASAAPDAVTDDPAHAMPDLGGSPDESLVLTLHDGRELAHVRGGADEHLRSALEGFIRVEPGRFRLVIGRDAQPTTGRKASGPWWWTLDRIDAEGTRLPPIVLTHGVGFAKAEHALSAASTELNKMEPKLRINDSVPKPRPKGGPLVNGDVAAVVLRMADWEFSRMVRAIVSGRSYHPDWWGAGVHNRHADAALWFEWTARGVMIHTTSGPPHRDGTLTNEDFSSWVAAGLSVPLRELLLDSDWALTLLKEADIGYRALGEAELRDQVEHNLERIIRQGQRQVVSNALDMLGSTRPVSATRALARGATTSLFDVAGDRDARAYGPAIDAVRELLALLPDPATHEVPWRELRAGDLILDKHTDSEHAVRLTARADMISHVNLDGVVLGPGPTRELLWKIERDDQSRVLRVTPPGSLRSFSGIAQSLASTGQPADPIESVEAQTNLQQNAAASEQTDQATAPTGSQQAPPDLSPTTSTPPRQATAAANAPANLRADMSWKELEALAQQHGLSVVKAKSALVPRYDPELKVITIPFAADTRTATTMLFEQLTTRLASPGQTPEAPGTRLEPTEEQPAQELLPPPRSLQEPPAATHVAAAPAQPEHHHDNPPPVEQPEHAPTVVVHDDAELSDLADDALGEDVVITAPSEPPGADDDYDWREALADAEEFASTAGDELPLDTADPGSGPSLDTPEPPAAPDDVTAGAAERTADAVSEVSADEHQPGDDHDEEDTLEGTAESGDHLAHDDEEPDPWEYWVDKLGEDVVNGTAASARPASPPEAEARPSTDDTAAEPSGNDVAAKDETSAELTQPRVPAADQPAVPDVHRSPQGPADPLARDTARPATSQDRDDTNLDQTVAHWVDLVNEAAQLGYAVHTDKVTTVDRESSTIHISAANPPDVRVAELTQALMELETQPTAPARPTATPSLNPIYDDLLRIYGDPSHRQALTQPHRSTSSGPLEPEAPDPVLDATLQPRHGSTPHQPADPAQDVPGESSKDAAAGIPRPRRTPRLTERWTRRASSSRGVSGWDPITDVVALYASRSVR